jgi:hypothetical protein
MKKKLELEKLKKRDEGHVCWPPNPIPFQIPNAIADTSCHAVVFFYLFFILLAEGCIITHHG